MNNEKFYGRNELKLLISYGEYLSLSSRLNAVLQRDKHSGDDGYFIRSLYLDDLNDSAYYDKLHGINERKKFRIRCYDYSSDYITLECKEKRGKLVHKTSAVLSYDDCCKLIDGDFSPIANRSESVCKQVYTTALSQGLHNAVIVDYSREAFVYPVSNVRITFDRQLHSGIPDSYDIFDKSAVTLPVYLNDSVILEIKYDDYLPALIRQLIPSSTGMPLSVSKYCLCRQLEKNLR